MPFTPIQMGTGGEGRDIYSSHYAIHSSTNGYRR
jgi:hypothetical protein